MMTKLIVLISILVFATTTGTPSSDYSKEWINPRIYGGQEIMDISKIPHHVTIAIYPTTKNETYCEGALLSTNFVLTAAVCFNTVLAPNYAVVIYFGAGNLNDATIVRRATKVKIHPDWNDKTLENNLAIIEFRPVPLNDQIQPIRLPSKAPKSETFSSFEAMFSGRGQSSNNGDDKRILRAAKTKVIGNSLCKLNHVLETVLESNICTWFGSEGICQGDEGGSLYITENDKKRTLIGMASFKGSECEKSQPSVFTRVSSYTLWINGVTSIPIRE